MSWIDVSVSQKKVQDAEVQRGRHKHRGRNSTLPNLGQQQDTHNYSLTLHLSTEANLALKSPVALHTSALARILRITDPEEGVAPSKIISLRCLHKHQHTSAMPIQKSRRSSFLPCHERSQSTNASTCVGRWSSLSHQRRQAAHTDLASTQPRSRCVMDSWV
jgi:hypothetical protein